MMAMKQATPAADAMAWPRLPSRSARLLQRQCTCGGAGGECAECRRKRQQGWQPETARGTGPARDVRPESPMPRFAHDFSKVPMSAKNKDAPSPAPPPAAKAPACDVAKQSEKWSACIQPVVIADDAGKNPTSAPSFAESKSIWGKCCVDLTVNATKTVSKTAYQTLDESKDDTPTQEEKDLFTAAGASACIEIFVPAQLAQDGKTGKDISGGGGTYDAGTANPKIVIVEGAVGEVVAHEVGHALGHKEHDANATVMKPTGHYNTPNKSDVSTDVCKKAKTGSVLTKGGATKDCCMTF